jgi:hypothetical protein
MQLLKLAIAFTASLLFLGCTSQPPQTQSTPTPTQSTPTLDTTTLKAAIEELEMLQIKLKSGINPSTYAHLIRNTLPIVERASGEAKAVAAMKSAMAGHQLALKFWQCDRLEGYYKLHQCRGKALSGIFAKYPDIKAQAKVDIKTTQPTTISTQVNQEGLLQRIWEKTNVDTEVAKQVLSPTPTPQAQQL